MDLLQELDLRIESLKRAALGAMENPEVKEYINILQQYSNIKFIKDNLTIEQYNERIDALMRKTDQAKENESVKSFIDIVEKHRSLQEKRKELETESVVRR